MQKNVPLRKLSKLYDVSFAFTLPFPFWTSIYNYLYAVKYARHKIFLFCF